MFHKWPSIENSYQKKYIDKWLSKFPELEYEKYIITEKLHGANIQFIIKSNYFNIATRNRILKKDEDFYGIWDTIPDYNFIIEGLQRLLKDTEYINIYGELFGSGIQKGVDYGPQKQIRFFGMRTNGRLWCPVDFFTFQFNVYPFYPLLLSSMSSFSVPVITFNSSLSDALNFDVENLISRQYPTEGNMAEGIVIVPQRLYTNGQSYFMLKKKSDKFQEKQKERKTVKQFSNLSSELLQLKNDFMEYINENRIESVFSKEGEIENIEDLGKYIKLVLNDAIEDFEKDYDISHLNKNDRKLIFKDVGKQIANFLKNRL